MDYKLFIGIDQSKLTFDACIIEAGKVNEDFHEKFENSSAGFKKFISWIKELFPGMKLSEVLFCAENTGWYGLKLNTYLCNLHLNLWVENALQIKLSAGLKRGKSDKADSKHIAHYCYLHRDKVRLYALPDKTLMALKQLLTFREQLVGQQTALAVSSKELSDTEADVTDLIVKQSNVLRKLIQKKIEMVDLRMAELVESNKNLKTKYELALSVHGVGKQTALFILVFTNGFTLFDNWKKFACYCGVAPFEYSSGTSIRGRTRVSSLGNKKIKSLLTMCALNTIKKENEFKIYYDRRIASGKSAMSTLNVIRNKIISRVFAAVNRGTPYEKNYVTQIAMA
jgi:transposase